jgi:hypothetical protein
MSRFVLGVVFGAAGSAIAYAAGANTYWTVGVGVIIACLICFGELVLDDWL